MFENKKLCIMKIKRPFMIEMLWKETIEQPFLKPNSKLEHVMIQFRLHNNYTSDKNNL
jgi:hypothetical protein